MKEQYQNAEMEVFTFAVEDVITTSDAYVPPVTTRGPNYRPPDWNAFD